MLSLCERLSIITSKAQTTRHRILGSREDFQVILSDTSGIIKTGLRDARIHDEFCQISV
jgi:GTPase Era involved in 16S rRNA processing